MDKEELRRRLSATGAVAIGFAEAAEVATFVKDDYIRWIKEGKHAGMDYLERHIPLKSHPRHVLEGAATVISLAFSYAPPKFRDSSLPMIACYAYGEDYHDIIRKRLMSVVTQLKGEVGEEWRICIDSAPLAERYWAMKSGIGRIGKNGSVIVDNFGSYIFLAEILTTLKITPDEPREASCIGCGMCVRACPQKAISSDGTIDSNRCLNYLTIEHRGEWEGEMRKYMSTDVARNCLYGCDICLRVCPHNHDIPITNIAEFYPKESVMTITADEAATLDQAGFSQLFKGSPIKRAKLAGILRNAKNLLTLTKSN